jgi:hypothetical protein
MTKYLIFSLKYYTNCVSILYIKCCSECRVVLLTERTFFTIVFWQMFRTLYFALAWPFSHFFYESTMPYNKKLTDLNRSGSTGKYPTSVLLYWPRYHLANTARPRLDIFSYCPHSRSVSYPRADGAKRHARVLITPGYLHPGKGKH